MALPFGHPRFFPSPTSFSILFTTSPGFIFSFKVESSTNNQLSLLMQSGISMKTMSEHQLKYPIIPKYNAKRWNVSFFQSSIFNAWQIFKNTSHGKVLYSVSCYTHFNFLWKIKLWTFALDKSTQNTETITILNSVLS